jgi:hypothetical protein
MQEFWNHPGICSGTLTYQSHKSAGDRARFALLRLLLPDMDLPEKPYEMPADADQAQYKSLVSKFYDAHFNTKQALADDTMSEPLEPQTAEQSGDDVWCKPPKADGKWDFGPLGSSFANATACVLVIMRQVVVNDIVRVSMGKARMRRARMPDEKDENEKHKVRREHLDRALQLGEDLCDEVYLGTHDRALIDDIPPFNRDGTKPTMDELKSKWVTAVTTGMVKDSRVRKVYRAGEFYQQIVLPIAEQLAMDPCASGAAVPEEQPSVAVGLSGVSAAPQKVVWALTCFDMASEAKEAKDKVDTADKNAKHTHAHAPTRPHAPTHAHTHTRTHSCLVVPDRPSDSGRPGQGEPTGVGAGDRIAAMGRIENDTRSAAGRRRSSGKLH